MTDGIHNIQGGKGLWNRQNMEASIENENDITLFNSNNIENVNNDFEYYENENEPAEENNTQTTIDEQAEELYSMLGDIKEKQGVVSSVWNSLKSFVGAGTSTKKCEKAIEDFKSGKLSFEEAQSKISEFESKQESSVNMFSNIVSGIAVTAAVGSAIATGGLSLAVVGGSALLGGATKAGLKFADRATNRVKGDALNKKQLAKDGLSGAVEGVATAVTMGVGTAAKTAGTVAEAASSTAKATLGQTLKTGIKEGAKAGGIAGAVTGAGEYTIDAALEEDVEFDTGDMFENTAKTAFAGAITGGVMGGITSGIGYAKSNLTGENNLHNEAADIEAETRLKKPENGDVKATAEEISAKLDDTAAMGNNTADVLEDVKTSADEISAKFDNTAAMGNNTADVLEDVNATAEKVQTKDNNISGNNDEAVITPNVEQELNENTLAISEQTKAHIHEAKEQVTDIFKDVKQVKEGGKITARAKTDKSIMAKLIKKFKNHKLKSTDYYDSEAAIADAYGSRVQLRSLTPQESKSIIDDCLYGYDINYDDFIKYMHGETTSLNASQIETLDEISDTVIDLLKEKQTQDAVDSLIKAITDPDNPISITELNNYGDNLSSYFTNRQNQQIADAYAKANPGKKLDIVTKFDADTKEFTFTPQYDSETGNLLCCNDTQGNIFIPDKDGNLVSPSGDLYTPEGKLIRKNGKNAVFTNKGAEKDSGYSSSHLNTVHKFKDGRTGLGELQIRGTEVNAFADAEHIPYDIRMGKITETDAKYADVWKTIISMDENSYKLYNQYINDTYKALRLNELGIHTELPTLDNMKFTADIQFGGHDITKAVQKLDMNGLIELSKRHD